MCLLQGVGGSVMADEQANVRVWIRLYAASFYFQRYMWGKYDPERQTLEPFPGQPNVAPLLSGYGLDAIRNLDPDVHWPIYDYLAYFDAMIHDLEYAGWVPGTNLFGMPWDWRQSMCWPPTMERMRDTILNAKQASGRNVTLVTHSMGALVVKCFIATYPDIFESSIADWIAIAAPFQGAGAKIFIEFLQGYNLGNIVIGAEDAKGLSLEAPAVYELLPRREFAWEQPPYIAVTINGTQHVYSADPGGSADAGKCYDEPIRRSLVSHTITLPGGGPTLPQPFNDACWRLSEASRAKAANVTLPDHVRFYNVYGVGQPTIAGLDFIPLQDWKDLQSAKYATTNVDGDGTVPAESAAAPLMKTAATKTVLADHMAIMTHPDTLNFVMDALYGRV